MQELNKYVLQYMLFNGVIKCEDGNSLIRTIAAKIEQPKREFSTVVSEINDKISAQLFKIDTRKCEITGEKMCVFINKSADDICKTLGSHTPAELELFDNILTTIMTADSKTLSSIICLNLTSRMKANISKDQAQDKIDNWVKSGYLVKKDGYIYLGARTISEFETFFRAQFAARMTTCKLCTDYVYYGKVCAECNEILHIHCSTKFVEQTNKCPICKKPWREAEAKTYNDEEEDDDKSDESMNSDSD